MAYHTIYQFNKIFLKTFHILCGPNTSLTMISVTSAPRFCVSVHRQRFPEDLPPKQVSSVRQGMVFVQPGHIITLMPPVRIVNLLPLDLNYTIKGTDIQGTIKPGKTAALSAVSDGVPYMCSVMVSPLCAM